MSDKTSPGNAPATEGPRSFSVLLTSLDDGAVHTELSQKLHAMVSELRERSTLEDRKLRGEMKLHLKVDVRKGVAEVTADVETKLPRRRREPTTVWVTKGGNLTTEVPRQERLPLRDASAPAEGAPATENRPAARDA